MLQYNQFQSQLPSISISTSDDLPELQVLMSLWYRSSLEDRSKLDQWMIDSRNLKVELRLKLEAQEVARPRPITYPDVCICGHIISSDGTRLRRWCDKCHGKLGQWLPPIACEAWIIELTLSRAIYLDHEEHPRWNTET